MKETTKLFWCGREIKSEKYLHINFYFYIPTINVFILTAIHRYSCKIEQETALQPVTDRII